MDESTADLIKFALGGAAAYLAKSAFDWAMFIRKGRSMKEANLLNNVTKALGREEQDHEETRVELRAANLKADYYRNRTGQLEYLLERNGVAFEPGTPPEV